MFLEADPCFGKKIFGVKCGRIEPALWGADNCPLMLAQPGPPPGKTAVGNDMVLALAHQAQIFVIFFRPVMADEGGRVCHFQIFLRPFRIIAEDEKTGAENFFGKKLDTVRIIIKIAGPVDRVGFRVCHIIPAANMQAY